MRSSNRAGFGTNRGALNPQIVVCGATAPPNPIDKMIWIDKVTPHIKVYDIDTTAWITIL